jgi:hypothetical protein
MKDLQLLAVAVLKRLLVSLAIFAVGFVSVCALFRGPAEVWLIAMLGALPWRGTLIFVSVSVIWFVAERLRNWRRKNSRANQAKIVKECNRPIVSVDNSAQQSGMVGRSPRCYCSFAYSTLASFRMGMLGSAPFQRVRKSWYALFALAMSPMRT